MDGSSVVLRVSSFPGSVVEPPPRAALEGDAVSVIEDPVEDGVPEGGVAAEVVPVLDGELGGEDGSAVGVAVVEDFEQVVTALIRQGSDFPVVEEEEPGLCEALDEPRV